MKIYIDVGNSRLKWRNSDGTYEGAFAHTADESGSALADYLDVEWGKLSAVQACWGCCVANPKLQSALDAWCQAQWSFKVEWLQSSLQQAGVHNNYVEPEQLGADRWAALLGARDLYPNTALCVVDAGTAITVDALSAESEFLGGTIIPGRALMWKALGHNTGQIPDYAQINQMIDEVAVDVQARSTQQAIASGIELTLNAGVTRIIQEHLTKYQHKMAIIVTGGDALRLDLPYAGVKHEPDLIFAGLAVVAEQH